MSLDCYPLGAKQIVSLPEQPVAINVSYHDNLFITVTNHCHTIQVYNLEAADDREKLYSHIKLEDDILVEQLVYCQHGDYMAFVGDKNGYLKVYAVSGWRNKPHCSSDQACIIEIEIQLESESNADSNERLLCIDACHRTGNLAVGCSSSVLIYRHTNVNSKLSFAHIVTINLSISPRKINLLENYLAVIAVDHVQVLKLELLTLQLQSDSFDVEQQTVSNGILSTPTMSKTSEVSPTAASNLSRANNVGGQVRTVANEADRSRQNHSQVLQDVVPPDNQSRTATNSSTSTTIGLTTCSLVSESNSETTATNFSSITCGAAEDGLELNNSDMSIITIQNQQQQQQVLDAAAIALMVTNDQSNDDCITWNLNTKKLVKLPTLMHNTSTNLSSYHVCHPLELLGPASESIACRVTASIYSTDYCQNQLEAVVLLCKQCEFEKDPVKSLHLEAIYLSNRDAQRRVCQHRNTHLSSNQSATTNVADIEPSAAHITSSSFGNAQCPNPAGNHLLAHDLVDYRSDSEHLGLLKSSQYDLLASVTCFVATLTSCFVYSLNGKKVAKLQSITYPDVCLDFRPDLLNVHVLTPLGLQICSNGICDSMLRYDWSSSADLNLSFIATNRIRVLTTNKYVLLVASQVSDATDGSSSSGDQCVIEYMEKPKLEELHSRFLHVLNRCSSVSIRSNMLTYLHASTQMSISCDLSGCKKNDPAIRGTNFDVIAMLKSVTIMLCKQLYLKKQSNVITNSRIDKAIKHLLDISYCNLGELMSRHLSSLIDNVCSSNQLLKAHTCFQSQVSLCGANDTTTGNVVRNEVSDENDVSSEKTSYALTNQNRSSTANAVGGSGEDSNRVGAGADLDALSNSYEQSVDADYELIKIYLKHAKHSQCLLDYLLSQSANEQVCARTIGYIFEHNPRLLIKCAQRYPIDASKIDGNDVKQQQVALATMHRRIMWLLVDRLKQLAELDSTGINRATVLFTLAILYESLGERQQCLRSLEQIKPFQHLAITMRSHHELSHSIAPVVQEKYPEAYELFLAQLAKRDPAAVSKFEPIGKEQSTRRVSNRNKSPEKSTRSNGIGGAPMLLVDDDEARDGFGGATAESDDDDDEADDESVYERKLRLFSEIPPSEIIDMLASVGFDSSEATPEAHEATRAHIKASINLLESQYLLARLNESYASTHSTG